jgi:hypothetical protein
MTVFSAGLRNENSELITSTDLVNSANALMEGIDLDVASSALANKYVGAKAFYTPSDDGLNVQPWYGKVYLFPPSGCYFWEEKNQRWKMTRSSSNTLTSSHAVWFRRLYREWMAGEIEQGLYFSNCPDMIRYEQKIFDLPLCILKIAPILLRRVNDEVKNHKTCTSILVYLPPTSDTANAIDRFVDIYSEKGRILC